jgi:hypothetical protein
LSRRNGPSDTAPGFGFARPAFVPAVTRGEAEQRLNALLGIRTVQHGGSGAYANWVPFGPGRGGDELDQINTFLREVEYLQAKYGIPSRQAVSRAPVLDSFIAGDYGGGGRARVGGGFTSELAIGNNWGERAYQTNQLREQNGQPRWTWADQTLRDRFGERDTRPSTSRHELGHTFSARPLTQAAWEQAIAEAKQAGQFPRSTSTSFGGQQRARSSWFQRHVSEYGGSDDWWEEVAEVASTVSSHEYVPGTLPAALEAFVARLYQGEFFR